MEETKAIQAYSDPVKIGMAADIELRQTLLVIFSLVGLTNYPDKHNEVVLLSFLRSTYPTFSLKETVLAFQMAAACKFDVNVDHYQQFSPAYFSRIMTAYKNWVTEVRKQYDKPIIEQPKVTVSENHWRGTIQKTYETFSEKTNFRLWPTEFYDQLQVDGFIELRYHEGLLTKAREMLCAEANKKMMETGDEIKLKSLQDLITAYRGKYREFEVILLSKQLSVRKLFEFGKTIDTKGLYAFEATS